MAAVASTFEAVAAVAIGDPAYCVVAEADACPVVGIAASASDRIDRTGRRRLRAYSSEADPSPYRSLRTEPSW